jgi:hypothetical protein
VLQNALTFRFTSYFGGLFLLICGSCLAHSTLPPLITKQSYFSIDYITPPNHCAR